MLEAGLMLYRRNSVMKVSKCLLTFLMVALLGFAAVSPVFAQSTASKPVAIAAASDLQFALPEIAAAYTRKTGNTVVVTYGSSGNLSSQIANGAPFDILLSADASYPRQLIASGNANSNSITLYARGSLAIWFGPSIDLGRLPRLLKRSIRRRYEISQSQIPSTHPMAGPRKPR